MFDQRSYQLMEELIKHYHLPKQEMMRKLNVTEKQFKHDLSKVNELLRHNNLPEIKIINQVIQVHSRSKTALQSNFFLDISSNQFVLSEQQRIYLIYLYTYIRCEPISNFHLQYLLKVSKNTALSDVKKVRELCKTKNVILTYSRKDGYHLQGKEFDKRRMAILCVNHLLSQPLGKETIILALKSWGVESSLIHTREIVEANLKQHSIYLVKSRKAEFIFHLTLLKNRTNKSTISLTDTERDFVIKQNVTACGRHLSEKLFKDRHSDEFHFITILLLTAQEGVPSTDNPELEIIAGEIIDEFEKITLLPIENKQELKQSLYHHLVPAYFRIKFEIPFLNPLTETIQTEYKDLFEFVKRSLVPLSNWSQQKISDAEVEFFTLHFGGFLRRNKKIIGNAPRALIMCSNGLSSSIMLEAQLKEIFPTIQFFKCHTVELLNEVPASSYDMIFSTIPANAKKPVFVLKPILSQREKNFLIQSVLEQFPEIENRYFSVDHLMKIIKKHTRIINEDKLFSDLLHLFYSQNKIGWRGKPMLSELLTNDTIHFTEEQLTWKDAIKLASLPLLESNIVEQQYVDAMIQNVEEIGTYIHIGKGIAIPHARPENGVNQLGMSFLLTRKPVLLLDKEEHKIDIFICLAAIDNEAHLKALAQLTKILADDSLLKELKNALTAQDVIEIIKKGEI